VTVQIATASMSALVNPLNELQGVGLMTLQCAIARNVGSQTCNPNYSTILS